MYYLIKSSKCIPYEMWNRISRNIVTCRVQTLDGSLIPSQGFNTILHADKVVGSAFGILETKEETEP